MTQEQPQILPVGTTLETIKLQLDQLVSQCSADAALEYQVTQALSHVRVAQVILKRVNAVTT